jgi:hypothetical protein
MAAHGKNSILPIWNSICAKSQLQVVMATPLLHGELYSSSSTR